MNNNQSIGVNKLLLVSTILLILFGVAVVYTASAPAAIKKYGDPEFYLKAHCSKVLIAFVAMFVASRVDYSIWKKAARPVFIVGCALTLAAVLVGPTINGANRWIWGIQPSEILKFGFILMVATKLSDAGTEIKSFKCSIVQPGDDGDGSIHSRRRHLRRGDGDADLLQFRRVRVYVYSY